MYSWIFHRKKNYLFRRGMETVNKYSKKLNGFKSLPKELFKEIKPKLLLLMVESNQNHSNI